MPLRHDIPIASDLVFVTGHGPITATEGASLARQVLADVRLAPEFGMLVRLGDVASEVRAQDAGPAKGAAADLKARGLRRAAIVAADDHGFEFGREVAASARRFGLAMEVFRDDIEAVTWLLGDS
jgi:hypothetical protein